MGKTMRSRPGVRRESHRSMRSMEVMIREGHIRRDASCTSKTAYSVGGAAAARQKLGKKRKRVTIYHCRFCGSYHLTSGRADS